MVDISELRDWAVLIERDGCEAEAKLVRDAADEIERLRHRNAGNEIIIGHDRAEIERLRAERDIPLDRIAYEEGRAKGWQESKDEIERLRAEVLILRSRIEPESLPTPLEISIGAKVASMYPPPEGWSGKGDAQARMEPTDG